MCGAGFTLAKWSVANGALWGLRSLAGTNPNFRPVCAFRFRAPFRAIPGHGGRADSFIRKSAERNRRVRGGNVSGQSASGLQCFKVYANRMISYSAFRWSKTAYALSLLCGATAIALPAQTFTTLVSFDGTNGAYSYASVVQGLDGSLYGTTKGDGVNGNYGTVFKITPSGVLTTLYSFCSQSGCRDGAFPQAGLVQATNGDLYGTASGGGEGDDDGGTVFKITPSGTLTTLYSFCSQAGCTDGAHPFAGLVPATNGDLYGTTYQGGCNGGCGTIFKITLSGTLTTLHSFDGTDGLKLSPSETPGLSLKAHKPAVPQVPVLGPLQKLEPSSQLRPEPSALLHLTRRQPFASSPRPLFRQIAERACLDLQRLHLAQ